MCVKDTVNKVKRQPMEWEKIFANPILDKELISMIYKELLQFHNNNNSLFRKCAKDVNKYFSKEDIKMAEKYMKRGQYH